MRTAYCSFKKTLQGTALLSEVRTYYMLSAKAHVDVHISSLLRTIRAQFALKYPTEITSETEGGKWIFSYKYASSTKKTRTSH